MKTTPFRRVVLNINVHSFDLIAAHILSTARWWRCNRLMVTVSEVGEICFADISHGGRTVELKAENIIGTFGYGSQIEVIEDAVIWQQRQMSQRKKEQELEQVAA